MKQGELLYQKPQPFPVYPLTYMISCNNYYTLPYCKILKISPGAYIFQRPFLRGLSTVGNLCFKIDWASLIVGSKFTVFALFYFVFEGNFPSTSPWEAYIWRGDLTKGFCITDSGGLYLRGLLSEFYGICLIHFEVVSYFRGSTEKKNKLNLLHHV